MSSENYSFEEPFIQLLYEALLEAGKDYSKEAVSALAERIKRLEEGLPCEDEFSMLLGWLGNCQLVHKLGQDQAPPESINDYRIPDLLTIFAYNDRPLPVLIDVKATKSTKLFLKPKTLIGLQNYAKRLGLPLLVAWKIKPFDLWALFDISHFKCVNINYKINFDTALKENLLSHLAGDYTYILRENVGFHVKFKKISILNKEELSVGHWNEEWLSQITDAYFTNGNGDRISQINAGLWALFTASHHVEDEDHSDPEHISVSFFVDSNTSMNFAQKALPALLKLSHKSEVPLNWRRILLEYKTPIEASILKKAADNGLKEGFVQYILLQRPNTLPEFLG